MMSIFGYDRTKQTDVFETFITLSIAIEVLFIHPQENELNMRSIEQ